MPLPSSGQIAFSQLAAELGNACTNVGLRAYSACANLTSPDGIIELRGKSCCVVYGAGTWSAGGAMITGRRTLAGAGTQNEGLLGGGRTNVSVTCTEEYNGTSWSAGGVLITAKHYMAGAGVQGAGLVAGGYSNAALVCTEEYNKPIVIIDTIK